MLQGVRFVVPGDGMSAESLRDELLRCQKAVCSLETERRLTNADSAGVLAEIPEIDVALVLECLQDISLVVPRGKHDLQFTRSMLQVLSVSLATSQMADPGQESDLPGEMVQPDA